MGNTKNKQRACLTEDMNTLGIEEHMKQSKKVCRNNPRQHVGSIKVS